MNLRLHHQSGISGSRRKKYVQIQTVLILRPTGCFKVPSICWYLGTLLYASEELEWNEWLSFEVIYTKVFTYFGTVVSSASVLSALLVWLVRVVWCALCCAPTANLICQYTRNRQEANVQLTTAVQRRVFSGMLGGQASVPQRAQLPSIFSPRIKFHWHPT